MKSIRSHIHDNVMLVLVNIFSVCTVNSEIFVANMSFNVIAKINSCTPDQVFRRFFPYEIILSHPWER